MSPASAVLYTLSGFLLAASLRSARKSVQAGTREAGALHLSLAAALILGWTYAAVMARWA